MAHDYETEIGKVRLLIPDVDEDTQIFDDNQIAAYISMARHENIFRAAALAVEAIAGSEVMVSKVIRTQDLSTDGAKVSDALLRRAEALRKRGDEDDDEDGSGAFFDIVPFNRTLSDPELVEGITGFGQGGWGQP